MEDIIPINPAERQAYVPAEVKVIDITTQGIICTSIDSFNDGGTY